MVLYSRAYIAARTLLRGDVIVLTLFALLGSQVMNTGANFLTLYLGI
jgi:NADH-quinone oxidoreductase subunit N